MCVGLPDLNGLWMVSWAWQGGCRMQGFWSQVPMSPLYPWATARPWSFLLLLGWSSKQIKKTASSGNFPELKKWTKHLDSTSPDIKQFSACTVESKISWLWCYFFILVFLLLKCIQDLVQPIKCRLWWKILFVTINVKDYQGNLMIVHMWIEYTNMKKTSSETSERRLWHPYF